jgi:hypothetical protein
MKTILFSILLFFITNTVFSQDINTDPYNNRIIQKYYTKAELTATQANHFDKFKQIKYYYIHSFILDENSFVNCPNFNPQLFDINDYNHLRSRDRRREVVTSCNVRLILLSQIELDKLVQYDGVLPAEIEPSIDR